MLGGKEHLAMKRKIITISLVTIMLTPVLANGEQYTQADCDAIFSPATYPGLNAFCLYLIEAQGAQSVDGTLRPGYSNMYMKEDYGIYRDYSQYDPQNPGKHERL